MKYSFILFLLLLAGCSLQKRKYQKGFYVNWHKAGTQQQKAEALIKHKAPQAAIAGPAETLVPAPAGEQPAALAFAGEGLQRSDVKHQPVFHIKDGPCDEPIFNDGTDLKAKVTEITDTEIKYKKCDMPDGPVYIVKKSDVFMVRYANGTKEMFNAAKPVTPNSNGNHGPAGNSYNGPKTTHLFAILSLVFGITGIFLFIGSIPAIILGDAALRRIRAQPDIYEGELLAKVGKILGIIGVALKALILMIFILAIIISL